MMQLRLLHLQATAGDECWVLAGFLTVPFYAVWNPAQGMAPPMENGCSKETQIAAPWVKKRKIFIPNCQRLSPLKARRSDGVKTFRVKWDQEKIGL